MIVNVGDASFRLWTFAGTQANRTRSKQLANVLRIVGFDEFGIDCVGESGRLAQTSAEPLMRIDGEDVARYAGAVKFSVCIGEDFLRRLVGCRYFGVRNL